MTAAKIAVTVPRETFIAVERRRRTLGATRSAVVTAALRAWLDDQTMTAEERRYLLAYLRHPETTEELRDVQAMSKLAVGLWEPFPQSEPPARAPRRRAKSRR